jgi:hypothetical protein
MKTIAGIIAVIALAGAAACGGDDDSGSTAVNPPSDLKVEPLEGGAHITWKDNSDNESQFMIDRKTASVDWMTIGMVPFNTTQYHDASIMAGMTYMYRVMAMPKSGGDGTYSGEVTFMAPADAGGAGAGAAGSGAGTGGAGAHDAHH